MKAHSYSIRKTLILTVLASAMVAVLISVASVNAKPSGEMGSAVTYKGEALPTNEAADKGLKCLQLASGKMTCFDSLSELNRSKVAANERAAAEATSTATTSKSRKVRRRAKTASSNTYMMLAQHKDGGGWNILGYARHNWYNLTGSYNDAVSSADAGNHSGYLAMNYDGGGTRMHFFVNQEVWNFALEVPAYNDRMSSRYRN